MGRLVQQLRGLRGPALVLPVSAKLVQLRLGSMGRVPGRGQNACTCPKHNAMAPCSDPLGALLAQAEGCWLDCALEGLRRTVYLV